MPKNGKRDANALRQALGGAHPLFQEALFEATDDALNVANHPQDSLAQCVVISTRFRGLIDRYINREIGIRLHIHSRHEPRELEGRNQAFGLHETIVGHEYVIQLTASRKDQLGIGIGDPRSNEMQFAMPIFPRPIVKDAKHPMGTENEQFRPQVFNNVVRLYRLDHPTALVRDWAELPGGLFEIGFAITDRKLQVLLIGGKVLARLLDGARIDTRIKSGPELIEQFAKFEREYLGESVSLGDDPEIACPVIVYLENRRIGVIFNKVIPQFTEGFAVSLCAPDAIPAAFEGQKRGS